MNFKVLTLAIVLPLTWLVMAPSAYSSEQPVPTIAVSGVGNVDVAPDMAIVSVGVVREGKTAREALDANTQAMAKILAEMESRGLEQRDLQTSNFNIQPRYFYPKAKAGEAQKPPSIIGYVVSNNLDIRIRDLNATGEILDLVVTLGVNSGGNIRFTNQDTSEILKQARVNAVKNAISKASTIAEAAGIALGDIQSITENFAQPRPVPFAQARSLSVQESSADRVPVAGGENSYRVTVNISWEIDQ